MAETITLPKSRIVLTIGRYAIAKASILQGHVQLVLDIGASVPECGDGLSRFKGTRDECIAWLDARVLELRAASLPADARERVARAISDEADLIVMEESRPQRMLRIADAGLAALGGKP